MSSLSEYLVNGVKLSSAFPRQSHKHSLESGNFFDEYAQYTTFNIQSSGRGYGVPQNFTDEFGYVGTLLNGGSVINNPELFDFGDGDFTVRFTFGVASYYGDDALRTMQVIPFLHLAGPGIANPGSSPFCFGMMNGADPDYVAKGDLFYALRDEAGNSAYGFISVVDWFLPPSGFSFARTAEITRRGQNFTLHYEDGYGARFVSLNFPDFGKIAAPRDAAVYIFCGPGYSSIESIFQGLNITKGIARTIGAHRTGTYNQVRKYPSIYPVEGKNPNLLRCIDSLLLGLSVDNSALGYAVASLVNTVGDGLPFVASAFGNIFPLVQLDGEGFKEMVQSPAPFDFDSVTRYLDYDFGDASTLTMSGSRITAVADKSGNSRNAVGVNTGPLIAASAINGLSATAPDTFGYLSLGTHLHELAALDEDFYIILVYRPVYNTSDYKPVLHQQFISGSGWLHFGIQDYYTDSSSVQSSLVYVGTNWAAHTYDWKYCIYEVKPGDVKKTRRNGAEITSVAAGVINDIPSGLNAYLGSDGASSDRKSFYGNIVRFAIVKSSDLNVHGVEQYIWLKYGLPLPESHVYYDYLYAFGDSAQTDVETATSGNVLTNDIGHDIYVYKVNGSEANVGVGVAGNNGGTFTIAADGAWTFDPSGDFALLAGSETAETSVTYYASDGVGEAMGTLTVTVSAASTTEWTPAEITTSLWLDAGDPSTIMLNGSKVIQWSDKSGNGRHVTQGTDSLRPTLGTNKIVFGGSHWLQNATAQLPLDAFVCAIVFKETTVTVNAGCFSVRATGADWNSNDGIIFGPSNKSTVRTGWVSRGGNLQLDDPSSPASASPLAVYTINKLLTSALFYRDGSQIWTDTFSALSTLSKGGFVLGARTYPSVSSPYLRGEIMEIVYAPAVDQQKLDGYLAHKWDALLGVTTLVDALPADHPYKSAAPTI